MYGNYKYYVLDTVSETIIGSFWAKSDAMARKILSTFDTKKARISFEDILLRKDPLSFVELETYTEVLNTDCLNIDIAALVQKELQFEDKKDVQ